ncbi:cysteine sulfinic acid decarboxylase-like [Uranotaenia lowii]|uniref:cysteine sulfinic acid decarboxylase-like n=1 Tax=Uranotaenia lowii TaxID=190385 RepID=UPI00247AB55F|nr:cysteine sulfinic acid decarboxylase-like [Uranotaenia lowii]
MCDEEWNILGHIPELLDEQNCIKISDSEPVVRFEHPSDLKELFDFTIDSTEQRCQDEIIEIIKKVLHFSVKTGHRNFHNQLFAGVDPYGLAGSWITDALNTSHRTPLIRVIRGRTTSAK